MAGTIVGFVLARSIGVFGFHLTFTTAEAYTVPVVEEAAIILLATTAWPSGPDGNQLNWT